MAKLRLKKKSLIAICAVSALLIISLILGLYFLKWKNNKPEPEPEPEPEPIVEKEKINIIDVDSKTRPYAIMINCLNEALPQTGLQDAYIVYELRVEGGITRMMALFKDIKSEKIGSIRSARIQFLDYAVENDAIYVHAGGANDAIFRIKDYKISDINPDGKYGFRDKELRSTGVAFEHTLFTNTDLLDSAVKDKNIRSTTEQKNLLNYTSKELDLSTKDGAKKADNISIRYSNYRTSNYEYDAENKVYLRSMNSKKNVDRVTGEQYKVKNIIVYGVTYTNYCEGSYCKYNKIDNIGEGTGYYITNGYAAPIKWKKQNYATQTVYSYLDGTEIEVSDGNTYIQIYPKDEELSIS